MSLKTYTDHGFKLFPCRPDKTPDVPKGESWKDEKYHLTVDQAEELQSIGRMIGAWIPPEMVVIDLDCHEGKPSGIDTIKGIKEQYGITLSFFEDTFTVSTPSGGYHIFYITDNEYTQNSKAPGIDLKTHKGYVIAAGSPGYAAHPNRIEPALMPESVELWLDGCEDERKPEVESGEAEDVGPRNFLTPQKLKNILDRVDVTHFRDNDTWLSFVMSCMAVAGTGEDVQRVIEDWSAGDPKYDNDRSIKKRLGSFDEIKKISTGTFLYYVKEENITKHQIREIKKLQSSTEIIENAQRKEKELPFNGINYQYLYKTPEARAFYTVQGHTNAASLLYIALHGKVLYVEGEKISYYFDDNKWTELHDPYSVIYTILSRVTAMIFHEHNQEYDNNDCLKKTNDCINALYWKESVWKEFTRMTGIYNRSVEWDGPQNRETLTCNDGVIDFSGDHAVARNGTQDEYRRHYIDYSARDILDAGEPQKFLEFLDGIMPDKDTLATLEYYLSCMISGNASKRIFSIWKGSGKNGKSTLQEIMRAVVGHKLITPFDVGLILQTRDGGQLGVTPEQAKLQGVLAAFTSETDASQKLNTTKIKNLCGDETITANPKHRDPIEFEATWQMILLCNDFPRFNANDSALIDRLLIIPFDMKYVKSKKEVEGWVKKGVKRKNIKMAAQKKRFIPLILKERKEIIKWLINKYIELENKHDGVIPESDECKILKNRYVKENDDFGLFVERFCIVDTEKEYFTTNTEITEKYREFMDNKKLSVQYVTNGIIKATNEVVKKDVKRVESRDEYGNVTNKQQRGLLHIIVDENKLDGSDDDGAEIVEMSF